MDPEFPRPLYMRVSLASSRLMLRIFPHVPILMRADDCCRHHRRHHTKASHPLSLYLSISPLATLLCLMYSAIPKVSRSSTYRRQPGSFLFFYFIIQERKEKGTKNVLSAVKSYLVNDCVLLSLSLSLSLPSAFFFFFFLIYFFFFFKFLFFKNIVRDPN